MNIENIQKQLSDFADERDWDCNPPISNAC